MSIFPSPAGMSLTKLTLGGNKLNIPAGESLVSDIPAGDGNITNLFYSVGVGSCDFYVQLLLTSSQTTFTVTL
jgi:hypothetical protein